MSEKLKATPRTLSERINADAFARVMAVVLAFIAWIAVFVVLSFITDVSFSTLVFVILFLCVIAGVLINETFGYKWDIN